MNQINPTLRMESAALALGILSLVLCSCFYLSIPFGALAIILATLGRGADITFTNKQRIAIILGIAGIVVTILFYAYAVYTALVTYGGIDGVLKAYSEMSGISYSDLLDLLQAQ